MPYDTQVQRVREHCMKNTSFVYRESNVKHKIVYIHVLLLCPAIVGRGCYNLPCHAFTEHYSDPICI